MSTSTFSSPAPVGSRLTSGFGQRWGILHAGTDYGPPSPGQRGVEITAVHAGTIIGEGYGQGRATDPIPYHSGRYIWQDIGVHGGDRMRIYYGHNADNIVRAGDHVDAGQVIAEMGGSGKSGENHFAIHLHLGVAQNHSRPVRAARGFGDPGWINADAWIRSKGIIVGQDAPVTPAVILPAAPATPATSPHVRTEAAIKAICVKAGLGTNTNSVGLLIERYQHRQIPPFQLFHDRIWGPKTERHYQWVKTLQSTMNLWKGDKLTVDGHYDQHTANRVRDVQDRNRHGLYRGYLVDGIPGPATCRMLGIPVYPN